MMQCCAFFQASLKLGFSAAVSDRALKVLLVSLVLSAQCGKTVVIAATSSRNYQRTYDRHLYKARHLIENFFARLKQYRASATRYDKTARNFLGAIHLAAAVVWLN